MKSLNLCCVLLLGATSPLFAADAAPAPTKEWNQWGGSGSRNNVPEGTGIPTEWAVGDFDFKTGEWKSESAENIKWASKLGSQTYGNCVIADGKASTTVRFSAPGTYVLRADADDGILVAAKDVTVTVSAASR